MAEPTNLIPVSSNAPMAHDPAREPELYAAARRVAADVDAVRDDALEPVNRDVDTVVTTVLGANKRVQPLLAELATMPGLDVARVRKLGDYADALLYWSASATYAVSTNELAAMVEKGIAMRERTIQDLRTLARHGVLEQELLEGFGEHAGYRKVARDLVGLSNLVHERWPAIRGRSMITLEAMDEAARLGKDIMQAVGDRDVAQAEQARDLARRNRAYTLVVRTYAELRSALAYLRRAQGDADKIAPSLFSFHKARKGGIDEADAAPTPSAPLGAATSSLIVPDAAAD